MNRKCDSRALGVFDSGLGGLTVARAVRRAFPHEPICYVGDTARVPYGTRSPETVQLYARQIIEFLVRQGVKYIIAACNTVSAAALPHMHDDFGVPVIGVVEMGAEAALAQQPRRIGVIGTETTVLSEAYPRAIHKRQGDVEVLQKACPLFVPLIEEGWLDHDVTRAVAAEYLEPMKLQGIDTLILGCTHYPLIRPILADFFGPDVRIVDSAEAMVRALRTAFAEGVLLPAAETASPNGEVRAASRYYVTDRGRRFEQQVTAFMGENGVHAEQISYETLAEALNHRLGHDAEAGLAPTDSRTTTARTV